MKDTKLISSVLFLVLILFINISFAQEEKVGLDEPSQEAMLNNQLWKFAKGTSYSSILPYIKSEQKISRSNNSEEVNLPTGWKIAPAGEQLKAGRLPYMALIYNGKLVVFNTGYYGKSGQVISVIDIKTRQIVKSIKLPSIFPGACVGLDGKLYVSGGFGGKIYRINLNFDVEKTYPVDGYVSDVAPVDVRHIAVAFLTSNNKKGFYGKGQLTILNTITGKMENKINVGYFPYSVKYVDRKIYVSVLGENKVKIYNRSLKQIGEISVGKKPGNMYVNGNMLYVVNMNSDDISVIDTKKDSLLYNLDVNNRNFNSGATPTSCTVSGDLIYVTEAGINAVAAYNKNDKKFVGYIPVGWYPTYVLYFDGKIFVLNAKGILPRRPNPNGPQPVKGKGGPDYVLKLLQGSVSIIHERRFNNNIERWTNQVKKGSPLYSPAKGFRFPIKYVFYIIRENRTYDQVLGDLGRGNGDSTLTIFGREVTPNGHSLAKTFVDLDNYFVDGEISVLGHSFTTSGYASPFLELLGNIAYSGRYKGYPFGTVPAVFSPDYIWDALDAKHINYKIFGEPYYLTTKLYKIIVDTFGPDSKLAKDFYKGSMFLASKVDRGKAFLKLAEPYYGKANSVADALKLLDNNSFSLGLSKIFTGTDLLSNAIKKNEKFKNKVATFLYHYSFNYYTWDLHYSDLNRVKNWKKDFELQLKEKQVPQFQYIWLPNDHTGGTNPRYPNPYQMVAQNDAALGMIVQTISHSSIWKNSIIFVEEDDAQNGPDHVDATRTVALAAGPYVKRGKVVHDRYDQLSMLRTIELILGIPPLNLDDALAVPMYGIFTKNVNYTPYNSTKPSKYLMKSDVKLFNNLEKSFKR